MNRKTLLDALRSITRVAKSSTFGVLFSTENNQLTITSVYEFIRMSVQLNADVSRCGDVIIPHKILMDGISTFNADYVSIENESNNVVVTCGAASLTIRGVAAQHFPTTSNVGDVFATFTTTPITIKTMIDQTSFAMCKSDLRPVLTGMLWEYSNGTLRVVSADGFRVASSSVSGGKSNNFRCVVPPDVIKILTSNIKKHHKQTTINVYDKHIEVAINNTTILARLLDGPYLNVDQYVPSKYSTTIGFNPKSILPTIKRAMSTLNIDAYVRLQISDIGNVIVSGESKDKGTHFHEELVVGIYGEEIDEIRFTIKYLHDTLTALGDDDATMKFSGKLSPCVFESPSNAGYWSLLMPVRIT